jgi:putative YhbY family RNA-binding protein
MIATSTLSSSGRRALRAAAHHLDPVVMVGQHGLTPAVLHEIDLALTAHALIKVRVQSDERETRETYLAEICQKLGCESVQHLGKLLVLWRNAEAVADVDEHPEQDAAIAVASRRAPAAGTVRGPRSKLASERNAAGNAARGNPAYGSPRGGALPPGERRRYGEVVPDQPRREGWAPKDRRGAARFGTTEDGGESRRRDGGAGYGAPRGRALGSADGYGGSSGSGSYRGSPSTPAGRSGYAGNSDRGGSTRGGTQGYGERRSYGGQGDGAPRARWGEQRREPTQAGAYNGGTADDRSLPKQRSSFGRNSETGGFGRNPRSGGGAYAGGGAGGRSAPPATGGWGNRDGLTGKPSGFSRGPAGGTRGGASAKPPRARRRMG